MTASEQPNYESQGLTLIGKPGTPGWRVGLRGEQAFLPVWGEGYLVKTDSLDADQRKTLGLDKHAE